MISQRTFSSKRNCVAGIAIQIHRMKFSPLRESIIIHREQLEIITKCVKGSINLCGKGEIPE